MLSGTLHVSFASRFFSLTIWPLILRSTVLLEPAMQGSTQNNGACVTVHTSERTDWGCDWGKVVLPSHEPGSSGEIVEGMHRVSCNTVRVQYVRILLSSLRTEL